MNLHLPSLVLTASFLFASAISSADPAVSKKPDPAPDKPIETPLPKPEISPFRKQLLSRLNELLSALEENYPVLAEDFQEKKGTDIITQFATSFNSGIEYYPADQIPTPTATPENSTQVYSSIIIASQKVLYIRMDNFGEKSVKQFVEDAHSSSRLARTPIGVILDLRDCRDFNYVGAMQVEGALSARKKAAAGGQSQTRILSWPIIILTGSKTQGASEVLAVLLEKHHSGLTMGAGSAGKPFPKKKTILSNGDLLLIPQIPAAFKIVPATALQPAVKVKAYPQISYEKLSGTAGSEQDDTCLRRAVDLLISLEAIHKKQTTVDK